ncbi:MAG: C4-dicarboxylate ABC transporter, partial [Alphaproteobacteria bacterium]
MGPCRGLVRRWLVAMAFGTGICLSLTGVVSAEDVTLKLHHFLPPQSPAQAAYLEPWARSVEAQSGGRIKIEIY